MKSRHFFIVILILILLGDIVLMADKQFGVAGGELCSAFESSLKTGFIPECFPSIQKPRMIPVSANNEPSDLEVMRRCYSDVTFDAEWIPSREDWLIHITSPITPGGKNFRKGDFWWAGGRFLPEDKLDQKENYWPLIYEYQKLKDPATLTEEEILKIREFASAENRQNGKGSPMFFYDFLYAAKSQVIIEDHIVYITFLGKKTKVHERIKKPVLNVEKKILAAAALEKTENGEVTVFIKNLKSADAYNWRIIEGTGRKSFHTYGIAMDLLPSKLNGKAIFWSWTKDKDPKNWMLTPVEKRWNPPSAVIDAFESEGFIWGGNWIIFDNMHFEYHPEMIFRS